MAVTLTTPKTLLGTFEPKAETARLVWAALTVVLGTLFIAVCSKINVPTFPVPITLQTLAVALVAAAFGWRIGVATVVLYIVEGLAGIPVFSGMLAGPAYVFVPSFGFIVGFLPMAFIIGRAADAGMSANLLQMLAAVLLGDVVCFVIGCAWLAVFLVTAKGMGLDTAASAAFANGVQPFILWDLLKMAFAAVTISGAWTLLKRKA